ncbi:hypothetical protein P7C71_g1898, partial [Lecanoromycetidae sp. Uapishka_2]
MLATSRSLIIGVLLILSVVIFFQGLPVPQLRSALSTHPNNATGVFVGETATDMFDEKGSRIYQAHGIKEIAPGEAKELKFKADKKQAVLQKENQSNGDSNTQEESGRQQDKTDSIEQKINTEKSQEQDEEEQDGDWHRNQVEAAKAMADHNENMETLSEDWHSNQVARAKDFAKKHG